MLLMLRFLRYFLTDIHFQHNNGTCTVNDIPLPNAESYTDATPALALSVALGYVAHAVLMCSSILNIPLR